MSSRFRVSLWAANGAGRGPGTFIGHVDDAKDIGGSEQVNGDGEFFMTLPSNHVIASHITALSTHYQVLRRDSSGAYVSIFAGLVDDYEADGNELVFYGRDYLSLLQTTITGSNESYGAQFVGSIISSQLTAARAETNSRVNFISMGTIENTSTTTIALSSYQSRLEFIAQLADIAMADNAVRSIIDVSPRSSLAPAFSFTANKGSDKENVRLEYGGNVVEYLYSPGYSTLRTAVRAIGQKREGATLLYSTQTTALAPSATYGYIAEPLLFTDIIDQAALDNKARRAARNFGRVGKKLGLQISPGRLGPWEGYDLGDSIRAVVGDEIVDVNALYTVWGVEWIGRKNGSEELVLSLLPKDA